MLALPVAAWAQEGVFNFLRLPFSAHVAAHGGNDISLIEDDVTLAFNNPALLINASDNTLHLNYMTYISDSKVAGAMYNKVFSSVRWELLLPAMWTMAPLMGSTKTILQLVALRPRILRLNYYTAIC